MALTQKQREELRKKYTSQQSPSADPTMDRLRKIVQQQTPQETEVTTPEPQKHSGILGKIGKFAGNLGKDIVKPFAEVGVSAVNLGESVIDLAKGDVAGANQALQKERDVPLLGKTNPALTGQETAKEQAKKVGGYGAEIASQFFGGGVLASGAKGAVGKGLLKGISFDGIKNAAKLGSLTGALGLGGRQAQEGGDGIADVLLYGAIGGAGGAVLGPLIEVAGTAGSNAIKKQLLPVTEKVSMKVREGIDKGIKPYFSSTANKSVRDKYYRDAENAFATIFKYRPEIQDLRTGVRASKLPETRGEMLEALEETKRAIFEQYDSLAREAGDAGVRFDATAIVDDLQSVASSKAYSPEIRGYAERLINDVSELSGETPLVVQERIKELNSSLGSFFAGRTDKSKAQLDASVASKMREQLDNIIEASGEGYQVLRNQYASLKTVEKDLARQVALEARKNNKGLVDFTDIFTGADLVTGLVTGNPQMFLSGATGRALKEWTKYLNNPNKYIKEAFEILDNPPADVKKALDEMMYYLNNRAGLSIEDVTKRPDFNSPAVGQTVSKDLASEAKKYKSAGEFVRSRPVAYHGSPVELNSFSNEKGGIFFTSDYFDAAGYAGGADTVYEGYLDFKKPLVIDAKGAKWDKLNTKYGESTQEIVNNAQKDGYDGVIFKNIVDNVMDTEGIGESTVYYAYKPEDSFVNESQLEQIWKEANK